MQLQLPFLTLTNSYIALLTHAFWPSSEGAVAPMDDGVNDEAGRSGDYELGDGKGQGLLDDDDDD
jgi:hypothetical protein